MTPEWDPLLKAAIARLVGEDSRLVQQTPDGKVVVMVQLLHDTIPR